MTLVLLGGFSTVSAEDVGKQLYLCGDSPIGKGWDYGSDKQVAMDYNSETGINTATVTIESGNPYFVVSDGQGSSWDDFNGNHRWDYGNKNNPKKNLSNTGSFQLAQNSEGDYSNYLSAGTYKIVIDSETMVMSILKTTSVSFTVENNDPEAWSQLALYNDGTEERRTLGTWPGVVLYDGTNLNPNSDPRVDVTKEGNTFTVKLWVSYDDNGLILSNNKNGIGVDEGNNQMTLTEFAADKAYTIAAQTVPSSYSTTIYFINNNSWNRIALYNFKGSGYIYGTWPGKYLISSNGILNPQKTSLFKVSKAGKTSENKDIYKIELGDDTGYNTIIFTNNSGNQTGDIADVADGNYYYCDSGTEHGNAPIYQISTGKEYTTYVSPDKLDFTGATNLTAYIATSADNTNVTLKPVTKVPANTPLVLKRANEEATSHNVVVLTSDADDVSGNKLRAGDGTTTIGGESKFDYVLKNGTFFRATEGVVAVGKAYLHLDSDPGTPDGKLSIIFDDSSETDGIKSVENGKFAAENAYNLAGQKVGANYKGIVIVNGKKVVRK